NIYEPRKGFSKFDTAMAIKLGMERWIDDVDIQCKGCKALRFLALDDIFGGLAQVGFGKWIIDMLKKHEENKDIQRQRCLVLCEFLVHEASVPILIEQGLNVEFIQRAKQNGAGEAADSIL